MPLEDTTNEPVMTALPLNGNPAPAPALIAYDEVSAYDAETVFDAQLDVPCNDPVNPAVARTDPVTLNPFGKSILPLK